MEWEIDIEWEEKKAKMKAEWNKEVYQKAEEVDPGGELHWQSLAIGFFLAKGLTAEEAWELSRQVRL